MCLLPPPLPSLPHPPLSSPLPSPPSPFPSQNSFDTAPYKQLHSDNQEDDIIGSDDEVDYDDDDDEVSEGDQTSLLERSAGAGDIIAEFLRNGFPTSALERGVSWCRDIDTLTPTTAAAPPAASGQGEVPFFELITYDAEPTSTPSRRPLGRSITAAGFEVPKDGERIGEEEERDDETLSLLSTTTQVCPAHNGGGGVGSKGSLDRKTRKSKTQFFKSTEDEGVAGGEGHRRVSHISSPMTFMTWKRKSGIRRKRRISTVVPVIPEVSYTLEVRVCGGGGVCVCACMWCMCMCVHVHMCVHVCVYVCACVCVCVCVCMCVCAYMHDCNYMCIHA